MTPEFIKLFAPVLIISAWLIFAFRLQKPFLIGASLYFASFVGFSSNFSFVYRETHQFIQVFLILLFLFPAIRRGRLHWINRVFLVFLAFIVISMVYAPFDDDAKSQLINYLAVIGVVNYLFSNLRTTYDLDKILSFLATLTILLAFIGLVEFLSNPGTRIEATFSNPNYYGFFLGLGFCLVSNKTHGIKRYISLLLILFAIIVSGSRSAVAFPVFYYLYQIYQLKRFDKQVVFLLSFLMIIAFTINMGMTRFADKKTTLSDAERKVYASISVKMANANPLTGVGWGRFISEFRNYSNFADRVVTSVGILDVSNQDRRVTHNDYLRIIAELGWVAFVASILLTIRVIICLLKSKKCRDFGLPPVWFGLIFFSLMHNNMNNALFWFFFLLPIIIDNFRDVSSVAKAT